MLNSCSFWSLFITWDCCICKWCLVPKWFIMCKPNTCWSINLSIKLLYRKYSTWSKAKVLPEPQGTTGALISVSVAVSQIDTSQSCKSADTGLVCRVECMFSSELTPVPSYTTWWTEAHVCEQLAQSCYVERSDRDSNLRPLGCRSDVLTTTPLRLAHVPYSTYFL